MSWNEFIFSNQRRIRLFRHAAFWLTWWFYFWLSSYFLFTPTVVTAKERIYPFWNWNLNDFIRSFFMVSIHIAACYILLYFLWPKFLQRKKYLFFTSGILLLFAVLFAVSYFITKFIFPFIDELLLPNIERVRKNITWASADRGVLNAIQILVVALVIRLFKFWWIKQKEKEKLEKEKVNAELQLLKAQIHPGFLFSTLNNIIAHAEAASPKAPEMLIKLSDLLSYMLYECDAATVKLEKEISMIKEYISLEKNKQGEKLELTFQITGTANGQLITPLLLLPFIDNSFSYCNDEAIEQPWVNIDITIEDQNLCMRIINGIPPGIAALAKTDDDSLINVQKRLALLYAGRHELKINAEQELLMIHLNLKLEQATEEDSVTVATKTVLSYAGA